MTLPIKSESVRFTLSVIDILIRDDIFVEIIEYFTFKDLYNFFTKPISKQMVKLLGKFNFEYLRKHIIRFQSYTFFRKFGFYNRKLMSILEKINAVIAGGFASALFTGELRDSSDMNIFIPAIKLNSFYNKINKSGLKNYLLDKGYFEKQCIMVYDKGDPEKRKLFLLHKFLKAEKNIKINSHYIYDRCYYEFEHTELKRKVKIIFKFYDYRYQLRSKFGSFVIEKFDFTVVMCYIKNCPQKKKTIFNDWGIKRNDRIQYNCFHLEDILNKSIQINSNCINNLNQELFKKQCFQRFIKYRSRGFQLSESMNLIIPMITTEFLEYESLFNKIAEKHPNSLIEYH